LIFIRNLIFWNDIKKSRFQKRNKSPDHSTVVVKSNPNFDKFAYTLWALPIIAEFFRSPLYTPFSLGLGGMLGFAGAYRGANSNPMLKD
jgi:hypothetical protein